MNLHQHNYENTAIFNQPKMRGRKAGTSLVRDQLEKRKVVQKYARTRTRLRGQPTARKKGKASGACDSTYEMASGTLLRSCLSCESRSRLGPGQAVDQAGRSSGGILPPTTSPVLSRLALRAGGWGTRISRSAHAPEELRIRGYAHRARI